MDAQGHEHKLMTSWTPPKGTARKGRLVVSLGDETFVDELVITQAKARADFIGKLVERFPALRADEYRDELLRGLERHAAEETSEGARATCEPHEEELERYDIVRPERFITPEVNGLAVPVLGVADGKPIGRWRVYLHWADGKRESRALDRSIELPGDRRIWIHPEPAEPTASMARSLCGWSANARRAWLETGEGPRPADLFKRLCERIAFFIDIPEEHAAGMTATLALWSMLSYGYPAWDAVPYLYVGGPLGSGKSRVFEILLRLIFRPLASSNLTGPALFRTLHNQGGTLLFDEAERLRQTASPEVGELMSMLLAGYRRGGQATRLEPVGDTYKPVGFDVFGPKAMACISGLPPALASRSIALMMFKAGPESPKPRRRVDADSEGWQQLRDDLHALAMNTNWLQLADRRDVCPEMSGRDYELWQPQMALAAWIEADGAANLLQLVQDHAKGIIDVGREDQVPDADEILLRILADMWRGGFHMTASEILKRAKEEEPDTFLRWSPRGVAGRLRSYGIPKPVKTGSRREYRDVTTEVLRRIERSYGIDLGMGAAVQSTANTGPELPSQASLRSQSPETARANV